MSQNGAGHPWDIRQAGGGGTGQRRCSTLQEELPVIDDSSA